MYTVSASAEKRPARAWLVEGSGNQWNDPDASVTVRADHEPSFTVKSSRNNERAWLQSGRVVKMTPRALARFQSIPDSYVLPDKASLACTVIGNAVPSLLMREIVRPLL
jgi:DNA (cytosine-5)-methyltransferase 1